MEEITRTIIYILILLVIASVTHAAINWDIYNDETISGGDYDNLNVYDSLDQPPIQTTVDVTGGNILFLNSHDTSNVNVSGGLIDTFTAWDSSTVNITGGSIGMLDAPGSDAYFHIYGYDFAIETPSSTYILTGFWEDDSEFEIWLRRAPLYEGHYVLHEIPEPATIALLSLGICFLRNRNRF